MLQRGARLLDLDGSVAAQIGRGLPPAEVVVDLRELGTEARLWASAAHCERLRAALKPDDRHRPTFIGSGDYHFMSALLLEQFTEPLTLIVFDHHPDWERLPPRHGCGAWLNRALEVPPVRQIVHVGAASTDLDFPAVLTGNRAAAREGRIKMLTWRTLQPDPERVFAAALAAVPTPQVYVSIDKDCLRRAHAATNWEEGRLDLDFLLRGLRAIAAAREIVGLDITGDYSAVRICHRWKSWCARFDHPRRCTADGRDAEEIAALNAETNARILDAVLA